MARYHTLFTSIEASGPLQPGVPLPRGALPRVLKPFHSTWLGRIGETQVGPTQLGAVGIAR